jgi:hypothetical protein
MFNMTGRIRDYIAHREQVFVRQIHDEVRKSHAMTELIRRNVNGNASITDPRQRNLTVSLTTFGRRIHDVFLAIESIGGQSLRPGRVVLWLAEDEFDDSLLPVTVKNLIERGLSVRYCKDIKQYKKLLPTLQLWPGDIIITIDDDVIYEFDLVDRLHSEHTRNPNVVLCGIAKTIQLAGKRVAPYRTWPKNTEKAASPSLMNMPIGCGGVLYFPGCFHGDLMKSDLFGSMCPHSDDIWFKTMTLLNRVKVKSICASASRASCLIPIEVCAEDSLSMINILRNMNDAQLESVTRKYDLMKYFREELN